MESASPTLDVSQYKVLILDCDGVLLDSNSAKNAAFRRTTLEAGFDTATAERFATWQLSNFGLSRYVAFDRLLQGEFGQVPQDVYRDGLLLRFSDAVAAIYESVPATEGLNEFLAASADTALFVVSGSDQSELRRALAARGLASSFGEILGSPTPKVELLSDLIHRHGWHAAQTKVLFIGDAHADADAAEAAGIEFAFMRAYSTARESMHERAALKGFPVIRDLRDLEFTSPSGA